MSLPTYLRARVFSWRHPLTIALAGAVGLAVGAGLTWLRHDPHTATAETLTGTVTWSNAEDRLIAFEADGVTPDPLDGDTIYHVVGDRANLPPCLVVRDGDVTREDRRRVELDAVHRDVGGPQRQHLAVALRCLD